VAIIPPRADFEPTIDRFTGFADVYDAYRPQPPTVLHDLLTRLAGQRVPQLVVDLGSGTGLSTRFWAAAAVRVVGIDPTADMRRQAERRTTAANVAYREGFSHATGLPDRCADIVTCAQALHWMDPPSTFAEAARILRPGGVFAAYDHDWPPTTTHWEADAAYEALRERVAVLERAHGVSSGLKTWPKAGHLERMRASGRFRFTKEIVVHHRESGTADRLIGLMLSQGSVASLRKHGLGNAEIGLDAFAEAVRRALGTAEEPWYFSCRVRVGIV
jgi:ubiquinone/menaquinone biosynthesis C-methylase UbiE